MNNVAIVKANYTKSRQGAKASIRYIAHRPGKEREKITRSLFGVDGVMDRMQAYHLIDEANKGTVFFRLVISPDQAQEDTERDLHLGEITVQTMQTLEKRLNQEVTWVATEHNDHTLNRHVHVLALVAGRLNTKDFQALRETATQEALFQRRERDLAREQQQAQQRKGAEWDRQR